MEFANFSFGLKPVFKVVAIDPTALLVEFVGTGADYVSDIGLTIGNSGLRCRFGQFEPPVGELPLGAFGCAQAAKEFSLS